MTEVKVDKLKTEVKVAKMIKYGQSLIGKPYGKWIGQDFNNIDEEPMWSMDLHPPKEIKSASCAGLINLMLRHVGINLPHSKGCKGGTMAYHDYYENVAEKFDKNKIYPECTLIGRNYYNLDDQGHVAIVLSNQHVLQSFHPDGINSTYTLKESNEMSNGQNYYQYAVIPENWLIKITMSKLRKSA